jgi:hypothetical protein
MNPQQIPESVAVPSLLSAFAHVGEAQFARVWYRAKQTGELAIHTIGLNFDMAQLYTDDVTAVSALHSAYAKDYNTNPKNDDAKIHMLAAGEILASLKESLTVGIGFNSKYTHAPFAGDTYVNMAGCQNVKVHKESGLVYVLGVSINKTILEAGEYKEVKSRPLTIAKNKIRKELQTGHIRQLIVERVSKLAMAGNVIEVVEDDDWKKTQITK